MDQRTTELRRDIEQRRDSISHTVDEIENRVHPGHIAARSKHRMGRRLTSIKESIMGSDNGAYSDERGMDDGGMIENVKQAPETVSRRTRGNPLAAGAIAMGAGALLASLLPTTQEERRLVGKIQPGLEDAASGIAQAGRELGEDAADAAREGVSHVTESVKSAGEELAEEAGAAKDRVIDQGQQGQSGL